MNTAAENHFVFMVESSPPHLGVMGIAQPLLECRAVRTVQQGHNQFHHEDKYGSE